MKRIYLLLLLVMVYWATAQAQSPTACYHVDVAGGIPREHPLDIQRVILRVRFEPEIGKVSGQVTHQFEVLQQKVDSLFFDAPGIDIKAARLGGKNLKYKTNDKGVTVYPDTPLKWNQKDSITFEYTAFPRKGVYFIGWNDSTNRSRKQIWTQGQGIDHRYWIPSFDDPVDKVITETYITFDPEYKVISNGRLRSIGIEKDGSKFKTWHYVMDKPHALYLLMLAIGKYDSDIRQTLTGTPVTLWYYPEHKDRYHRYIYPHSTECVDFLEEQTKIPYPWESYANVPVQDFIYGAMENTTATIFGDFFCVDSRGFNDRNYIGVNVHELTHQWFGDYITLRASHDIWLHESFATYYPKLYFRKIRGEDHYQWQRRGEHNSALNASKTDRLPIRHSGAGTARVYAKGSSVIDMMNYVFGEEAYRTVIHHYLKKHAYGSVETEDLIQSFQDTLGISAHEFFDQWIKKGGEPHYHVSYQDVMKPTGRETQFTVRQTQLRDNFTGLFRMPVVFEVHYMDGGKDTLRTWVDQETQTVVVPNKGNREITYTLFDPGSWIIKDLTFDKPIGDKIYQALAAKNMIDRYDGLFALRNENLETKRLTLHNAYAQEKFHATKGEILYQLAGDTDAKSIAIFRSALKDEDIDVQKQAAAHLKTIPKELRNEYEALLDAQSWDLIRDALDKLCNEYPHLSENYLKRTQEFLGMNYRVHCKWLEISYLNGDEKAAAALADLTGNAYEFITRQNAMRTLVSINYLDDVAIAGLVYAWVNPNRRLAGVAKETMDHFMKQGKYRRMIRNYCKAREWQGEEARLIDELLK